MNIFEEMFAGKKFETFRDYAELKRMLNEAIQRGYVVTVPVTMRRQIPETESWYKELGTDIVYSLIPPEGASRGRWGPIPLDEYEMEIQRPS